MGKSPYIPFYFSDWIGGTAMLSASERGIYISLIAMMYETEQPIKMDRRRLARLCGSPVRQLDDAVEMLLNMPGKLVMKDGGLWQERVSEELKKRTHLREVNAQNAASRWEKPVKKQRPPNATASKPQCETHAYQNQNQNQNISSNEDKARKRATRLPEDWTPPEEWIDEAVSRGFTRAEAYDHAEQMRDWSLSSKAGEKRDWRAAWRNWVKRKLQEREARPADRQQSNTDRRRSAWLDVVDEIEREGAGRTALEPGGDGSVAYLPRARSGDA
jgi:uncharacterized protein YdaU (DUF1376 family)